MNTLAYIIYLFLTYFITVHVGLIFYRHGRLYILQLLSGDEGLTDFINKLLLAGYYLLNLGYAALMIQLWKSVNNWEQLVSSVLIMTGRILLSLAIIHYFNMLAIYFFGKKGKKFHHHKN